jgi:CheY-like chemotaxis protein
VARVLICEPHADIRSLLAFVVCRLGHEAILSDGSHDQAAGVDAILLEPGHVESRELAERARADTPGVAIVCTSIFPQGPETVALEADEYLVKPFPLLKLEEALTSALERRRSEPHAALVPDCPARPEA